MAVLVDDARWPAHGRHWAHLVSDTSLEELHAFARAAGLGPRAFDHDHYDVPDTLVPDLLAAGAQAVGPRELLRRLVASGLRVPARERPAREHPPLRGVAGILLAAGAGTRAGGPGALARTASGAPVLAEHVEALREGGCSPVVVVLGAGAGSAAPLVPDGALPVVAAGWAEGMSASLREGLRAAARLEPAPAAALVALLEPGGLSAVVVRRLVQRVEADGPVVLARAVREGRAAHPVLLGRAHWAPAAASARGDRLAGGYLREHGAQLVGSSDPLTPTLAG